jgi:hypothetical protein
MADTFELLDTFKVHQSRQISNVITDRRPIKILEILNNERKTGSDFVRLEALRDTPLRDVVQSGRASH